MRAVIQRVAKSRVTVDGRTSGEIQRGLMILIGVEDGDTEKDAAYIASKTSGLRIFEDENDKMNLSVKDVDGDILAVSQFTLLGDVRKGKRPSFSSAARPEEADRLYQKVIEGLRQDGLHVEEGVFQAHMMVDILNDGPVTILLDSRERILIIKGSLIHMRITNLPSGALRKHLFSSRRKNKRRIHRGSKRLQ